MIVAVAGGKGGVGKSTVSLNLANELDAVVVDADLSVPDLPLGGGPTLHDVLADRAKPSDAVTTNGSVRIVPSGRTLAGACASTVSKLPSVLETLERTHGRVVVDCPAGLARDVGVLVYAADAAVLVTMTEKPAVLDALRTKQLARTVQTPIVSVAVNQVATRTDTKLAATIRDNMESPTTVISKRSEIGAANESGKPVGDVYPDSSVRTAFAEIAEIVERYEQRLSRSCQQSHPLES